MVSRIETIDDLIAWLSYLSTLEGVTPGQFANMASTLLDLKPKCGDVTFKPCIKCHKVYPATKEFYNWSGQGRTGLHAVCKPCKNSYTKKYNQFVRQESKGDWTPEYLAEVNRIRAQEGKPPLTAPVKHRKKAGRPKVQSPTQTAPKPGEAW